MRNNFQSNRTKTTNYYNEDSDLEYTNDTYVECTQNTQWKNIATTNRFRVDRYIDV